MATRQEIINALPSKSVKKTLAAIEATLDTEQVGRLAWSYDETAERARVSRAAVRYILRTLELAGLITIGTGPCRVSTLALSDRWQTVDPAEVAQLSSQAKLPRPRRVRQLASLKPRKPVEAEPEETEPEPVYRTPSLPRLKFMGEL